MPSASKEVHRTYQQKHYAKNKDYYKNRRKTRKQLHLRRFADLKNTLSCVLCPESDNAALDLHHFDRTTKEGLVHRMVSTGISWAKIIQEIEKCVCLCANCHRKVHHYAGFGNLNKSHLIIVPDEHKYEST